MPTTLFFPDHRAVEADLKNPATPANQFALNSGRILDLS